MLRRDPFTRISRFQSSMAWSSGSGKASSNWTSWRRRSIARVCCRAGGTPVARAPRSDPARGARERALLKTMVGLLRETPVETHRHGGQRPEATFAQVGRQRANLQLGHGRRLRWKPACSDIYVKAIAIRRWDLTSSQSRSDSRPIFLMLLAGNVAMKARNALGLWRPASDQSCK